MSELPLLSSNLLARLERMELVSRKIFKGRIKGERPSRRKGQSAEFADFRNYTPGDDPRFIDWNLYARLQKLFLRLYMEEEDLHFHALIDASRSMTFGNPTKLRYAQQLAAALGFVGLCRADRVCVETLAPGPQTSRRTFRGRRDLQPLLRYLNQIQPKDNVSLASGVKSFCLRNSGKGIVVFLTDLMEKSGYQAALKFLSAHQLDVYLVQILADEEIHPDMKGELRLIDCEDQDVAEITVSRPLLERYRQRLNTFLTGVRESCLRRNISYVMASPTVPVEDLVSRYLRQHGLVK